MNEGESFCSQITEENNCAATSWSWSQSVIRTINLVIIVQPWSIIIMEACSYSTVINCCCLWLDCLLDLTLKSTYCAATLEASTCRPSVSCLCFTLCDCAPCWSSFTLWTALICQSDSSAVPQSDMQAEWRTAHSQCWWSTSAPRILSAMFKRHWQHRAP